MNRSFTGGRRSRVAALVLSAAIMLLIGLVLVQMGMTGEGGPGLGSRLTAVNLSAASKSPQKKAAAKAAASAKTVPTPQPRQPTPVTPPAPSLSIIHLTHDEFAASDISKLPRHRDDASDSASAGRAASTYGPGDGPGGAHLFNAEWYREPPKAALASYLPNGAPPGSWGMIACRTVERYHVEDCQELGESPPGSGLARALRQAAWQFLVRPPRVNGQPIIGAWVRIKFDFARSGKAED